MDARNYLTALRRSWWIPLAGALAGLVVAFLASKAVSPSYTSQAELFISLQQGSTAGELANGATFTQQQMDSYAQIATSSVVLDEVVAALNLNQTSDQLSRNVSATIPQNTSILQISATSPSAEEAANIANAVAGSTSGKILQFAPKTITGSENVKVNPIAKAAPATSPSSPKTALNAILGLLAGLLLGLAFVLLREKLDDRVRDERELGSAGAARVLGSLMHSHDWDAAAPRAFESLPRSETAEDVRKLRVVLQSAAVDQGRTALVVTSSLPGEGRSTVLVNLALAYAEAGVRTLVVDADLRSPSLAKAFDLSEFGVSGKAGLSSLLEAKSSIESSITTWRRSTLDVLPAGPAPLNPSELLSGPSLSTVLARLRTKYDVILVLAADTSTAADAAVVGRVTDGAVVVADALQVTQGDLQGATAALRSAGIEVVGLVLNGAHRPESASPRREVATP